MKSKLKEKQTHETQKVDPGHSNVFGYINQTGVLINGRVLAQTAVTLQMNTVTQPE